MWIFTRWGFFSCVCAREGDGDLEESVDPQQLMIRARARVHLETLQSHLPDLIGACEIMEYPDADYPFRIFVGKGIWSQVMIALSQELDYDNFKNAVSQEPELDDPLYLERLNEIACIMHDVTPNEELEHTKHKPQTK